MLTVESIEHIKSVVAEHGADAWWEMETADLLPPVKNAKQKKKVEWIEMEWDVEFIESK